MDNVQLDAVLFDLAAEAGRGLRLGQAAAHLDISKWSEGQSHEQELVFLDQQSSEVNNHHLDAQRLSCLLFHDLVLQINPPGRKCAARFFWFSASRPPLDCFMRIILLIYMLVPLAGVQIAHKHGAGHPA